jgi:hypothetical protein
VAALFGSHRWSEHRGAQSATFTRFSLPTAQDLGRRRRAAGRSAGICILLGLWAVLPLLACQAFAPAVSEDRVLRFFRDLAFGEDFSLNAKYDRLRRWSVSPRVGLFGSYSSMERVEVEAHLRLVSQLTGLSAELVDSPDEVNLEIWFSPTEDFRVHGEFVPCYAAVNFRDDSIDSVRITIGSSAEANARRCIAHELMHALGFPNHSAVLPSVASPLHGKQAFTKWDRTALRILYDRRLRNGMTEGEAMPLGREILHQIWRQGDGAGLSHGLNEPSAT